MEWTLYPVSHFDTYKQQWDKLNTDNINSPLLHSDFISPLITHFSTGKELLALCGSPTDLLAATIVQKSKTGSWSTFQPSQNPLGTWLQNKTIATSELSEKLIKKIPGICLVFGITQQDPDLLSRPDSAKRLATLDYIQTARIPTTDSFDDYWSKRGKNLRQNLRRQCNRLEREETKITLKCITAAEQIREAVEAYGVLESAGWKSESGTAISANNDQGRFYIEMLESFCHKGQGRIYQFWYDDKLVSTDLCITGPGTIIILKTTYDETIKTSSPAMLMRKEAFENIFLETGMKRIEFYGKLMDWHTWWSDEFRTMYHMNIYRHGLLKRGR